MSFWVFLNYFDLFLHCMFFVVVNIKYFLTNSSNFKSNKKPTYEVKLTLNLFFAFVSRGIFPGF